MDRLQQFRELRSTIRGNQSILVVGVDIAKEKHYAFRLPPLIILEPKFR